MKQSGKRISTLSIAFILIGALFGASSASGQEILKFFNAYGKWGAAGLLLCFFLYSAFGYMAYELSRGRNMPRMEDVVTPVDSPVVKTIVRVILLFGFFVVLTALLAAGDSLFVSQFGLPKGSGGAVLSVLVVLTNIYGFQGIRRVLPLVVPVMLVIVLVITVWVIGFSPRGTALAPEQFRSPLAPGWFVGASLYLMYNFILAIPIFSSLPDREEDRRRTVAGMILGFAGVIGIGFLIFLSIATDLDAAGQYDLPMLYLAGKISPQVLYVYFAGMVTAVYCASANTLYGLTRDIVGGKSPARIAKVSLTCLAAYLTGLKGFTFVVTYIYPVQGYACILVSVCLVTAFLKRKK